MDFRQPLTKCEPQPFAAAGIALGKLPEKSRFGYVRSASNVAQQINVLDRREVSEAPTLDGGSTYASISETAIRNTVTDRVASDNKDTVVRREGIEVAKHDVYGLRTMLR